MTDDPAADGAEVLRAAREAIAAGDTPEAVARRYAARAVRAEDATLDGLDDLIRAAAPDADVDPLLDELLGRNGTPPGLVRVADVAPADVRWTWPGRLPAGKLVLLDGDPSVGKSTLALDLAARLSTGAAMPDGRRPEVDVPGGTVLLVAEDGVADTIRPRLDAAGADVSRIARLATVATADDDAPDRMPTVDDVGPIADAIRAVDAALVVVDPLAAFLPPDTDAHRDAEVRRALGPIIDLADRTGVVVVAIRHLTKSRDSNPLYRGGGSIGLIGAARAGLLAGRDPRRPDGPGRVLAWTKMNLAPRPASLAYGLDAAGGAVRIAWRGEVDLTAADVLDRPTADERSARDEAIDFLVAELARGPRPVAELREAADDAGLAWRTVERAKRDAEIEAEKAAFAGPWRWRLPDDLARGGEQGYVAAFAGDDAESPRSAGTESKTATPDDRVAALGGVAALGDDDPPADPTTCRECGRRIGPTAAVCGRCRRAAEEEADP